MTTLYSSSSGGLEKYEVKHAHIVHCIGCLLQRLSLTFGSRWQTDAAAAIPAGVSLDCSCFWGVIHQFNFENHHIGRLMIYGVF